jgi:hypothetical protein
MNKGYIFLVTGLARNGRDFEVSYGLLFAENETYAKSLATSYFHRNNPSCSNVSVKVTEVVLPEDSHVRIYGSTLIADTEES